MSSVLVDVGRSLREAFFMFWETLWPLILGFGLSGAVQAFVSRDAMQRKLGDHRPVTIVRASGYGMVSSSCSYAASAMAKSLFVKGADYLAAMVFMFASTNLVVELGIVLIVLMGWQFAVSEFVGGIVMILLLATIGSLWLRGRRIVEARERLVSQEETDEHQHGPAETSSRRPWTVRARTAAGWADSATYTMSDLTMLRRELFIGYTVAGFLAVLVPTSVWHSVFATGHGFWTSLQNVIVGPFIAIISFVCSIGNVPLAAALWSGGISFGGVISFIFADLIVFPLLMIYRRYYGWRLMARMLIVFWALMSTAGLVTEGIFTAAGLVPDVPAEDDRTRALLLELHDLPEHRLPGAVRRAVLALPQPGALRCRMAAYARDPMCGMQVEMAHAPASSVRDGERVLLLLRPLQGTLPGRSRSPSRPADGRSEQRTPPHRGPRAERQGWVSRNASSSFTAGVTFSNSAML